MAEKPDTSHEWGREAGPGVDVVVVVNVGPKDEIAENREREVGSPFSDARATGRVVPEDPAGSERRRPARVLLWIGLAGMVLAAASYAIGGRPLLAGAFAVGAVSMALRHTRPAERSPGFGRTAGVGATAGFTLAALLVWLPLLTGNGP